MKLIAGIDPGLITAVAVVGIESGFYETASKRNFTFSEVCDYLVTLGEPVIISVDTMHLPETVKRVAAAFGARLHAPRRDLYIGEKKSIVEGRAVRNDHERDALAAAMHAKSFFAPLFAKVDRTLEKKSLTRLSAEVKELLVKNETGNIEQAVKMLLGESKPEVKIVPRLIETKKVLELRRTIERLQKENLATKKKADALEAENRKLKEPVRQSESNVVRNLRRSLDALLREKKSVAEEYALYKRLAEDYEILSDVPEKNRIVIFKDGMDVERLEKIGPKAIISGKFLDTTIPLIHPSTIKMERIGNFLVVPKDEIKKASGKESFIEWLSNYKEMRRNEA